MSAPLTLTLGNSYSRLTGLSFEQFREVREILSCKIEASKTYFSGAPSQTRYLIDKQGNFPSGLTPYVQTWYTGKGYIVDVVHSKKRPITHPVALGSIKSLVPYSEQQEAVRAAIKHARGVIQMPTGTGKSVTIGMLIASLNVDTLVVVPTLELKRQLTESLTALLDQTGFGCKLVVENIASSRLKDLTGFDCLIIDESHHAAAKTYRSLNKKAWKNIYFRYCFTATSFRANEEEQMLMEGVTGPVIYSLTIQQAVEKGYIVPVEAYYYDLPKQKMKGNPKHWPAVYSELIVNNGHRNALIAQVMGQLCQFSTLCLVKELAHGFELSRFTGQSFANGQDEFTGGLIQEFCGGQFNQLIGTTGVIGEGVDTKPAEYIILAGGGKSKTQFMQMVGRGVRKYPAKESCKVILFRDSSNPYLLKHFNLCIKYLREEYGIEPVKLDLSDVAG